MQIQESGHHDDSQGENVTFVYQKSDDSDSAETELTISKEILAMFKKENEIPDLNLSGPNFISTWFLVYVCFSSVCLLGGCGSGG